MSSGRPPACMSRLAPTSRACVHSAELVEVGVQHPRLEVAPKLDRNCRSTAAHDHARDSLRMRGRDEQCGRSADVRRDDVRRAEVSLDDHLSQEPAHRSWRQKVVAAFGCAESRQVDGEQTGALGEGGPHRCERVEALRPGAGEQERRLRVLAAVGVADPDSIDGLELDLWERLWWACGTSSASGLSFAPVSPRGKSLAVAAEALDLLADAAVAAYGRRRV